MEKHKSFIGGGSDKPLEDKGDILESIRSRGEISGYTEKGYLDLIETWTFFV